ncbi:hypothetical protein CEF21_13020 [Bacillus sp. FJAT-42376]|uniref:DUF6241 domain-containing protein n=1 Tax=Bacillus sp. FJAT-42376 TaxID=2014076 RepID=UPI000F513D07|nr:DUF6241 domain-containing protein [Bacillus sp. FJAT-42376]AZB43150.1 hypothetical protein CEF21_13020 [Bacillus sp. FJAT-42376]
MSEQKTKKRAAKGRLTLIAIAAALIGLSGAIYLYINRASVQTDEHAQAALGGMSDPSAYFSASRQWDDEAFQEIIHFMLHQKVKAKEKWGAVKITDDRIQKLDALLKQHRPRLENSDIYEKILSSWEREDFSDAVKDHNTIWALQDGTVGKATRLLTPEEEKAYIKKQKLK